MIKSVHVKATGKVIFDAEKDNNGKGVSPEEIIRLIKKIDKKGRANYKNLD